MSGAGTAANARAAYRRLIAASSRVPVPYVRRKTASHIRALFRMYAAPRYDAERAALIASSEADAAALEELLALPHDALMLFFRKNVSG